MPDTPLTPATESDRRGSDRYSSRLLVQFAVEEGPPELEQGPHFSRAANISPEGLQLQVEVPIPPSTQLELLISDPANSEAFLLRGIARWCRNDGSGNYLLGIWLDHGLSDLSRWQAHIKKRTE